jgi:hypothetical protein
MFLALTDAPSNDPHDLAPAPPSGRKADLTTRFTGRFKQDNMMSALACDACRFKTCRSSTDHDDSFCGLRRTRNNMRRRSPLVLLPHCECTMSYRLSLHGLGLSKTPTSFASSRL